MNEAREQAVVLHETVHATLQFVHHEYYREDGHDCPGGQAKVARRRGR